MTDGKAGAKASAESPTDLPWTAELPWTIDSNRPPTEADGPFTAEKLDQFMRATGVVGDAGKVVPTETTAFKKATHVNPKLKNDLHHLCDAYTADELNALAGALMQSAAVFSERYTKRRYRGPKRTELSTGQVLAIQAMRHRGVPEADIKRQVDAWLPRSSASNASRRKLIDRIITRLPWEQRGQWQVSYGAALLMWQSTHSKRNEDETDTIR